MNLKWNDERYRILGTNMFSFSRWSRENEPKPPPKYKVGDIVMLTRESKIVLVGEDCDGTALYGLDNLGFGFCEEQLKLVKEKNEEEGSPN